MRQPYPTYNRRNLLYADMDGCLIRAVREEGFGDNQDSLSFYRRVIEAGIETQLTPTEQQIIELRYRRGIPAAEASRLLGIDRSTANRRLNRLCCDCSNLPGAVCWLWEMEIICLQNAVEFSRSTVLQ